MSTKPNFTNESECLDAVQAVRKDNEPEDWCLFTYENEKSNNIVFLGKGSGGVAEMQTFLKDEIVGYGLVRKTDKIDDSVTVKFALIFWLGTNIPRMQRARTTIDQGAIKTWIGQRHVEITCEQKSELSDEIVQQKIMDTSGTHSRVMDKSTGQRTAFSGSNERMGNKGSATAGPLSFDEEEIKGAIAEVRSDSDATNWMVMGYEGNSNHVVLYGKGSDGVDGLLGQIADDRVCYGLVRLVEKIDETEAVKFCYIKFAGDNIPTMLRARIGTHTNNVLAYLRPYHVSLDATDKNEISEEIVMKLIKNASGTAQHVLDKKAPSTSSHSAVTTNFLPSQRLAQPKTVTSASTTNISTKTAAVPKSLSTTQTIKFVDEQAIRDAISDVRNDATETDWALIGYQGKKGNVLELLGKGTGSTNAMLKLFEDDIVAYGLLRKTDKIDETVAVKFVYVVWTGENINRMHRARLGTYSGAVRELFTPYHVDLFPENSSEISDEIIQKKIQSASGTANFVLSK